MSQVVDNLIAYRILTLLVRPFDDTDAFRLGIIDAQGNVLVKHRELKTSEQKSAYTYLHRLVFNVKRLINKLPGGDTQLKNLVAAFFLVKEAYESNTTVITESSFRRVASLVEGGVVFVDETLVVEDFLLCEEAPANATGPAVSTDQPVIRKPKRFAKFIVNDEVFGKFASGKAKYRRWANYLNLEDEGQRAIYKYAKENPSGAIILQNGSLTKLIRPS